MHISRVQSPDTCLVSRLVIWSDRRNADADITYWQNGPCIEVQSFIIALRVANGRLTVGCKSSIVLDSRISRGSG